MTWRVILVPRGRAPLGQHQESRSGRGQHRKSAIYGLPVTLRMLRVKSDKSDWLRVHYELSPHVQKIEAG